MLPCTGPSIAKACPGEDIPVSVPIMHAYSRNTAHVRCGLHRHSSGILTLEFATFGARRAVLATLLDVTSTQTHTQHMTTTFGRVMGTRGNVEAAYNVRTPCQTPSVATLNRHVDDQTNNRSYLFRRRAAFDTVTNGPHLPALRNRLCTGPRLVKKGRDGRRHAQLQQAPPQPGCVIRAHAGGRHQRAQ